MHPDLLLKREEREYRTEHPWEVGQFYRYDYVEYHDWHAEHPFLLLYKTVDGVPWFINTYVNIDDPAREERETFCRQVWSLEHIRDKWARKVLKPGLLFILEDASNARHISPSDIELYDQRFVFHVPAGQRGGMYLVMKDAKFSEERIEQSREYSIKKLERDIRSDTEKLEYLKTCSTADLMTQTWRLKT